MMQGHGFCQNRQVLASLTVPWLESRFHRPCLLSLSSVGRSARAYSGGSLAASGSSFLVAQLCRWRDRPDRCLLDDLAHHHQAPSVPPDPRPEAVLVPWRGCQAPMVSDPLREQ
jgi:hypothetical protein